MSSPTKGGSRYSTSRATTGESGEILSSLWSQGLSFHYKHAQRYQWIYLDNPAGPTDIYLLNVADSQGTDPAGCLGICRRDWVHGQSRTTAGILADFTITPKHRSLGPAINFQLQAMSMALEDDFAFVYGWPNEMSSILEKRIPYDKKVEIAHYTRVFRLLPYIRRTLPNWLAKPISRIAQPTYNFFLSLRQLPVSRNWRGYHPQRCDARFDTLWEQSAGNFDSIGVRDSAFLNWRFSDHPDHKYHIFAMEHKTDSTLGGYVVYCVETDGRVCIGDFLARDNTATLRSLFSLFFKELRKTSAPSATLIFYGSDEVRLALRKCGFHLRGTQPASFMFKNKDTGATGELRWFITLADNDT